MMVAGRVMGSANISWTLERKGNRLEKHYLDTLIRNREKITIGRRAQGAVDIVCNGKTVSRAHCELTYQDSQWHATDLKSMNGVYINGNRITHSVPTALREGDEIGIGCTDNSEADYYVFIVCKTLIKEEKLDEDVVLVKEEVDKEEAKNDEVVKDANSAHSHEVLQPNPHARLDSSAIPDTMSDSGSHVKIESQDAEDSEMNISSSSGMQGRQENTPQIVEGTSSSVDQSKQDVSKRNDGENKKTPESLNAGALCKVNAGTLSGSSSLQSSAVDSTKIVEKTSSSDSRAEKNVQKNTASETEDFKENKTQAKKLVAPMSTPSSSSLHEAKLKTDKHAEKTPPSFSNVNKSTSKESSTDMKKHSDQPGSSHRKKDKGNVSDVKGKKGRVEALIEKDKKLKMKCIVKVKKLSKQEIARYTSKESTKRPNKPRARRLIVSDDEEEEDKELQKSPQEPTSENVPVPGPSGINKEPQSTLKFVVEKLNPPPMEKKSDYTVYDVSDSDDDMFVPLNNTTLNADEEDDECIVILDSDEEIFSSQPRIKAEPPENFEAEIDDGAKLSEDAEERFFPELSQPFLEEIAEEERAEAEIMEGQASTSASSEKAPESPTKKLENIVAQHKARPKEKHTLPTEPKALDLNKRHTNKRFTLATGSEKSSSASTSSFAAKLKKDQDLRSYNRSVQEANAKRRNAHMVPASEQAAERDDKKSDDSKKKKKSISKEKSQGAVPVKAKVTKRSRGDILTAEMVQEGAVKRPNEDSGSSLANFTIPKKPKIAETDEKQEENNGDGVVEDIAVDVDLSSLGPVTPSTGFKAPVKRVSRMSSDDQRENQLPRQARPDPTKSDSPDKKRRRGSYQPRTSAIPLGGNQRRHSMPPRPKTTVEEWRKSRQVEGKDKPKTIETAPVNDDAMDATLPIVTENDKEARPEMVPETLPERPSAVKRGILAPPGRETGSNPNVRTGPKVKFDDSEKIRYIETKEEVAALMAEQAEEDRLTQQMNGFAQQTNASTQQTNASTQQTNASTQQTIGSAQQMNGSGNELARYNHNFAAQQARRHINAVQEYRPGHRERVQAIIDEMLARICNWNFSWIAEQDQLDEPPPILQATRTKAREFPPLQLTPVPTAFTSIDTYQTVFFPLMLHEIWGVISKDVQENPSRIKALLRNVTNDGISARLEFEVLVQDNSRRIMEYDLWALTHESNGKTEQSKKAPRQVFGIVDRVTYRKFDASQNIDPRLLSACRSPTSRVSFSLRMKTSNASKFTDQLISMCHVSALRTHIRQFNLVAELESLALFPVIMDPIKNSDVFTMMQSEHDAQCQGVLNEVQKRAVSSITETILKSDKDEPKVAMLQGPPGTGKSHVIVQLILNLLNRHHADKGTMPRILVCAPSNNAIDEIGLRLLKTEEYRKKRVMIVRVGVKQSVHPDVQCIHTDNLAKPVHKRLVANRRSDFTPDIEMCEEELKNLAQKKRKLISEIALADRVHGDQDVAKLMSRKLNEVEEQIEIFQATLQKRRDGHAERFYNEFWRAKQAVIAQAHIICTTLNSCRTRDIENVFLGNNQGNQDFLCCIIDEASQCTEPESLTPLALGINKLVLIGDPEQLPATVNSVSAAKLSYQKSLFNRFFAARTGGTVVGESSNNSVMMLNLQYRMAAPICYWPSKFFYARKLKTDPDIVRNGPGALEGRLCHYRVLNVSDGYETTDPTAPNPKSLKNEKEARVVDALVEALRLIEPNIQKHVAVITFYQTQKLLIQRILAENTRLKGQVYVNTVDGFQGQEKDIVILSCVKANRRGDVGFLEMAERMNVALTRARHSLIVCGHLPTLNANEAWRDLIADATHRGYCHTVTGEPTVDAIGRLLRKDQ